jgi:hypothetical protein
VSKTLSLLSVKTIVGVLDEQNYHSDDTKKQAQKEPEPCTAIRVLCPKRAKSAEQNCGSAGVRCIAGLILCLALYIGQFLFELCEALVLSRL